MIAIVAVVLGCVTLYAKQLRVITLKTTPEVVKSEDEAAVRKGLREIEGVRRVSKDEAKKVISVTYDAEKTDSVMIVKTLRGMHYQADVQSDVEAKELKREKRTVDGMSGASSQM